jgi:hypothetical protein
MNYRLCSFNTWGQSNVHNLAEERSDDSQNCVAS